MTITLNLPPQIEQAYLAEAKARGLTLEDLVRDVLLAGQPSPAANDSPAANQLSPDEWVREFKAWVVSHDGNTVVLPDAAMERESIYGDHGR
jgi:hypothetical protein